MNAPGCNDVVFNTGNKFRFSAVTLRLKVVLITIKFLVMVMAQKYLMEAVTIIFAMVIVVKVLVILSLRMGSCAIISLMSWAETSRR